MYSPENPLNRNWDRELESSLPDSRLTGSGRRSLTSWGNMMMERVFCANCGGNGGLITAELFTHVFYLCDDCAHSGIPEGCVEADENKIRGYA